MPVKVSNKTLKLFDTHTGHSYKCTANTTAHLTMTVVTFANVHLQPFGVEESKGFASGKYKYSLDIGINSVIGYM